MPRPEGLTAKERRTSRRSTISRVNIAGVQHISVNVSDAEEIGRFYIEVLGLERLPRPDFGFPGMWLRVPDGREIHLQQVEEHKAPRMQHFAFEVPDLDDAREELVGQDIKVSEPFAIPERGGRQCFFKDPAGNLLELNEPAVSTIS